jgi:hypothetical protein
MWLEIVSLVLDRLAWMPLLALTGKACCWEPERFRRRLVSAAGQLVNTERRRAPRLPPAVRPEAASLAAPGLQSLCDGAQIGFLRTDRLGEFVQIVVLGPEGLAGDVHVLAGAGPADDQVVVGEGP